jgi:TRAP-type C4-dicarboxylate transport system permease small subunit
MLAFQRLYRGYGRLLRGVGLISLAATLLTMALVVANIIGRYLFNKPLTGTLEFTETLLVLVIFCSIALTQYDGGHIRVVLMTRRLPRHVQRIFTVIAMLAGCAFFIWCSYAAWVFAAEAYSFGEQEWGEVVFPLWPVKFVVFFGLATLALQFLLDAIAETMMPIAADDERAMEQI